MALSVKKKKNVNKLSVVADRVMEEKSLTRLCGDNPAGGQILCENGCSAVSIPHKHEI